MNDGIDRGDGSEVRGTTNKKQYPRPVGDRKRKSRKALGLSIDRVLSRLGQENVNLTGGRLREGKTEYLVRTVNEFLRPEDLRPMVVDSSRGATAKAPRPP